MTTNAASNGRHTPVVHVPSSGFQDDWARTKVCFHDFRSMAHESNEYADSPAFFCLGYKWNVRIFPRGRGSEDSVSVFLCRQSSLITTATFSLAIGNFTRRISWEHKFVEDRFGFHFCGREKVLAGLQNGALVVEVCIEHAKHLPPFIPDNPSACKVIQDMYMDKESADVVFKVGGKHGTTRANAKKIKAVSTEFYAHRLILMKAAPQLAELCMVSNESSPHIIIPNMHMLASTFKDILSYIYGHPIQMLENDPTRMQNIIEAANKYGITNLKLETEVSYVSFVQKTFELENIMGHLLYADALDLAYLKEAVMDFIIGNKVKIMKSKVLSNAPGDIVNDVLAAVTRSEERARADGKNNDIELNVLGISDLRRRAHAIGVCVDGSREALIAAIESMKAVAEND